VKVSDLLDGAVPVGRDELTHSDCDATVKTKKVAAIDHQSAAVPVASVGTIVLIVVIIRAELGTLSELKSSTKTVYKNSALMKTNIPGTRSGRKVCSRQPGAPLK
jgi:hypothetical protein